MSEIRGKGVAKSGVKLLCMRLKSKDCQRSGQMASTWSLGQSCGKGVVKYDWNSSQKFNKGAAAGAATLTLVFFSRKKKIGEKKAKLFC